MMTPHLEPRPPHGREGPKGGVERTDDIVDPQGIPLPRHLALRLTDLRSVGGGAIVLLARSVFPQQL